MFLHHLFAFTDLDRHQLIVIYNRSKRFEDCTELLKMFEYYGIIDKLVVRNNDDKIRGSDNHKRGIVEAIKYVKHEEIVVIDSDMFVCNKQWVQMLSEMLSECPLAGVRHAGRGYIHPCFMIASKSLIMQYLNLITQSYEEGGDTLEILSKGTKFKSLEYNNGYVYKDRILLGYHVCSGIHKEIHIPAKFLLDYIAVIPIYGKYHKNVEVIVDSFEKIGVPVCRVFGHGDEQKFEVKTAHPLPSRAGLFNAGFVSHCAKKYIFHDRDLPVNQEWFEKVKQMIEECFVCHSGVWYGNTLEDQAVGGSLCVTWEAFLKVGGFDSNMMNWGLEDREMYLRCYKVLGNVGKLQMTLHHLPHDKVSTEYDAYKNELAPEIHSGRLDIRDRRTFIWKMIERNWNGYLSF